MKKYLCYILPIIISFILISACQNRSSDRSTLSEVRKVELRQVDTKYRLYVDGEEFYVKGAGCEYGDIEALANHGANSFRTWRIDNGVSTGSEVLDMAHKNGLMVTMGIEVGRERHGYDYNDEVWVAEQKERIHQEIMALKDHPALLAWGVGNELNLRSTNMKVWDAVNDISKMIHDIDGNHPTTTMLAGIGKDEVDYLSQNCNDLDFLSIQMYGDIENLHERIAEAGYKGPYLITEWGATGHWEVPVTEWGAPIEQTSTEKAMAIKHRYENVIAVDTLNCLGSYVFLWGQKQERTPTWYGLFTENSEEMEPIDVMHYFWNNSWPENRSPRIIKAEIEGMDRYSNIKLSPGQQYQARINFDDPDNEDVIVVAEIMSESTELGDGGDHEGRPESITEGIQTNNDGFINFIAPDITGPYRLFIYVKDQNNHSGTVNIPFLVTEQN
ncbi:MAG: glycoside hydrolase family 2 TIM barrel-domain containing protein [Bacteroidales bacterium]|nr:glycoside hydrolase family 2 TIM barrel-domain containing protein [Bacteroidales bacterium]